MKTELVLMLLCFLLASLAVLGRPADETDVEDKNEDHVKALEDARWGRKPYGRKSGRRKRPDKDQLIHSDWPWNKRTATDLDKDQKFFDWPWNKRTATDFDEDWPWNKRTAKDLDKDQKFFDWPWNKRTATDVDEDWPWNKRTAKDLDKDQKFFDWPWNKRTATDVDKDWPWNKRTAKGLDKEGEKLEDDAMKLTS